MQPFGRLIVHDRVLLADLIEPSFDDGNAFGDRLLPYRLVSGTCCLASCNTSRSSDRRISEPVKLGLVRQKLGAPKDELSSLGVIVHSHQFAS